MGGFLDGVGLLECGDSSPLSLSSLTASPVTEAAMNRRTPEV
jgi:hypothetical protein